MAPDKRIAERCIVLKLKFSKLLRRRSNLAQNLFLVQGLCYSTADIRARKCAATHLGMAGRISKSEAVVWMVNDGKNEKRTVLGGARISYL